MQKSIESEQVNESAVKFGSPQPVDPSPQFIKVETNLDNNDEQLELFSMKQDIENQQFSKKNIKEFDKRLEI